MEDNYIGEKIREIRKKNGLSQEEFAYRVNVAKQTVSCWELGTIKPNFKNIKVICEVFKVSADCFIQGSDVVCTTDENQLIEKMDDNKKKNDLSREIETDCVILSNQIEEKTTKIEKKARCYSKRIIIGVAICSSILIVGLIFILSISIFTTNVGIVTTQSSHWQISETFNIIAYVLATFSFVLLIIFIIKLKKQNKNKKQ